MPPNVLGEVAAEFDGKVLECFAKVLQEPCPSRDLWAQVFLPISLGGFGLHSAELARHAAFIGASLDSISSLTGKFHLSDSALLKLRWELRRQVDGLEELLKGLGVPPEVAKATADQILPPGDLPEDFFTRERHHTQRSITAIVHEALWRHWVAGDGPPPPGAHPRPGDEALHRARSSSVRGDVRMDAGMEVEGVAKRRRARALSTRASDPPEGDLSALVSRPPLRPDSMPGAWLMGAPWVPGQDLDDAPFREAARFWAGLGPTLPPGVPRGRAGSLPVRRADRPLCGRPPQGLSVAD